MEPGSKVISFFISYFLLSVIFEICNIKYNIFADDLQLSISLIHLLLSVFFFVTIFQLNLSELGRKYGISGGRANMIVKEFLILNGVDLSKFNNNLFNEKIVRRRRLKMPDIK